MMTKDRDYEDILRRALAAAAESIEPTGDGLQRIRHRLDSRRSARSLLSRCAEWLELHGTRLLVRFEPAIEWGRAGLRRALPVLASFLAGLFSPRGRAGGHRGSGTPSPPGRLGPAGAWLKPVFAVAAAVAIVVAGVVVLNHETQTVINPLNSSNPSGSGTSVGSGGKTANSKRWKLPLGVVLPTQQAGGQAPQPEDEGRAARGGLHPDPDPGALVHHDGTDRERHGHPDADGDRQRDGHARDTAADRHHRADAHPDGQRRHRRHRHRDRRRPGRPRRRRSARRRGVRGDPEGLLYTLITSRPGHP